MSGVCAWQQSWMNCVALVAPVGSSGPLLVMKPTLCPAIAARPHTVNLPYSGLNSRNSESSTMRQITSRMSTGLRMLIGIKPRRAFRRRRRDHPFPLEAGQQIARDSDGIGVVLGDELGQTRYPCVHLGPAQLLVGGNLTGRRLEQRRSGEESLGAATHHDDVIGQSG